MAAAVTKRQQESPELSIVVPVYECSECLPELYDRLIASLIQITEHFEIILVNDASTDSSWNLICSLAINDRRVRGVDFSRNFGQHAAIFAGLERATGQWIVVMDCDLQDRPEEIGTLYSAALAGFDQVVAVKTNRQHSTFQRFTSWIYVLFMSKICGIKINQNIGNFGIYGASVIWQIRHLKEQNLTFGLAALWVGLKRTEIPIAHAKRIHGKSTYSFRKLVSSAISGFTSFSDRPLRLVVLFGFTTSGFTAISGLALVIQQLVSGQTPSGWASLMVVMLVMFGIVIASVGIVGLYVGKTLQESKGRPRFIVRAEINFEA